MAGLATLPIPEGPWASVANEAFDGRPGRVLLAECRDGALLAALQASGVDAYGVEPSPLFLVATEAAVDVRQEAAASHLRTLPRATLGGVILAGCTQHVLPVCPPGSRLIRRWSRTHLGHRGGRILVVSSGTSRADDPAQTVAYDLAPGRPLHAETWAALLGARGFGDVRLRCAVTDAGGASRAAVVASLMTAPSA